MRQTTRRKYWGRSAVAQALSGAQHSLEEAVAECSKESELERKLEQVQQDLGRALEAWKIYELEQKRIHKSIDQLVKKVTAILQQVRGIPVTPEEKASKKITKKIAKAKGQAQNKAKVA